MIQPPSKEMVKLVVIVRNRGQIKWHAFDSLYKTSEVKKEISNNKNIFHMPELSPDQQSKLEIKLSNAYFRGDSVSLIFYRSGKFYQIKTRIIKINSSDKTILLDNGKILSLSQIVNIKDI